MLTVMACTNEILSGYRPLETFKLLLLSDNGPHNMSQYFVLNVFVLGRVVEKTWCNAA